jgi:HSP20 family protein
MATELEKKEQRAVTNTTAERLIDSQNSYLPDVDIFENKENVILFMDLPGVKKGDVDITVEENNTLIIRARSSFTEPQKLQYKQFNNGNYYRAFTLGNHFDLDKISTNFEDGVLKLTLPKREELKPKRIQISA